MDVAAASAPHPIQNMSLFPLRDYLEWNGNASKGSSTGPPIGLSPAGTNVQGMRFWKSPHYRGVAVPGRRATMSSDPSAPEVDTLLSKTFSRLTFDRSSLVSSTEFIDRVRSFSSEKNFKKLAGDTPCVASFSALSAALKSTGSGQTVATPDLVTPAAKICHSRWSEDSSDMLVPSTPVKSSAFGPSFSKSPIRCRLQDL